MEKRRLGRTNIGVTVVSFGGIPIIRKPKEEAILTVRHAYEKGINFFDTARAYQDSENKISEALQDVRDQIYYASKMLPRGKAEAAAFIRHTLKNMKTDYIDLYQCHAVDTEEDLQKILEPDGALAALEEARKEGKVKWIGVTGHKPSLLVKAVQTGKFDTVQTPLNVIERTPSLELLKVCQEMDIGFIVMKPLAGGALVKDSPEVKELMKGESTAETVSRAIRFCLSFKGVSCAIPGQGTIKEVDEAIAAGEELKELSDEDIQKLKDMESELGEEFCRRCGYCLPCPEVIDIPNVLRIDGYYTRYHLQEWAKMQYKHLTTQPDVCAECGACETRCPYHLPIRRMLKDAVSHLSE